jgi:hypothetical protein
VVPLAIAVAVAVAACGGSGHAKKTAAVKLSPAQLVSQSFDASDAVSSGQVGLSVDLRLDGISALEGKPIALALSGPFEVSGGSVSTDLQATVSAASSSAKLGLDKVGDKAYLGLDGTFYELPAGAMGAAAAGPTGSTGSFAALGSLGIDPRSWLTDPTELPQTTVDGVLTDHLQAQINVAAVLGDVSKLITRLGGAGSGAGSGSAAGSSSSTSSTSSSSSPAGSSSSVTSLLPLIESAITQAQIDVYTGAADHIVRKFDLTIAFTVPQIAAGAIDGLTGGSLTLDATLSDLNKPETITAPANPQPSSKLLNGVFALESQFGSLASLVSGLSSAT